MSAHAFLSASGAPAWLRCEAKPWREKDLPDVTSPFAEEGTKAHELLECFIKNAPIPSGTTHEMLDYVRKTLNTITELAENGELYSEQRLDISFITGEEGAQGTADVVIVNPTEIVIVDLKYGRGVAVEAEDNEQLLIYGAAALREFDLTGDIATVKMVISQPRLNSVTEWVLTVQELNERIQIIRDKAQRILAAKGGDPYLHAVPGDKQCKFCKVKNKCSERNGFVIATVTDDHVDLDKDGQLISKVAAAVARLPNVSDKDLATYADALSLIKDWVSGVETELENRLINDSFSDPRWKLVQGRGGNRKLEDVEGFLEMAHEHRIPEEDLYEKSLLSAAQLEKKHKKEHPVFWAKAEPLFVRPSGKPVVAPQSDKRPAISHCLDFEVIEDEEFIESLIGMTHQEN